MQEANLAVTRALADPYDYFRDLAALAGDSAVLPALRCLFVTSALRDDDTGRHTLRVGYMAELIGHALGLDEATCVALRVAAPMHDIGKLAIPDVVLFKPGPLDAEEIGIMRRHSEYGARILAAGDDPLFTMAATIAGAHHERFDGGGYPYGLRGEAIPLCARITAICDCFDALSMPRCYRPALDEAQVLAHVRGERGGAFDPQVVDAFERCWPTLAVAHACLEAQALRLFEQLRSGAALGAQP